MIHHYLKNVTMKQIALFILFFLPTVVLAQPKVQVLKENLSPKMRVFWDKEKKHLQGTGSYFVSQIVRNSTEKHGKWQFFSFNGDLEEESNFYRNRLHGKQILYYPNKKMKQQCFFSFNVPDSTFKKWNEDGTLVISGNYVLGSPEGKWEYFYDNGKQKSIENVSNDTIYVLQYWENDSSHTQTITNGNGVIRAFYTNGVVKESYTFKNGLKTGPFEERTANGVLSVSGEFLMGKKNGVWEFYEYMGLLEKKIEYKNDSLHGNYEVYYPETGEIDTKGQYNNGKKTGNWIWKTPEGKTEMAGAFIDDQQDGKWEYYYPNGQLSYFAHFDKGKKTGNWTYYYENGAEFKKGDFKNDQKDGTWKTFYENGKVLMVGDYSEGKETGEWNNFWEDGTLKNKSSFKKGQLSGKWFSYTPTCVKILEGTYKKNLKSGEWREYYNNGRLKEVINYKVFKRKNRSNDIEVLGMNEVVSEPWGKYEAYSQIDFKIKAKGQYKKGVKNGTWYDYYPGGVIPTIISQYKNGKLHGTFKQLGRQGELMYEIHYKNGLKHGLLNVYGSNGQIVKQKMFRYGHEMHKKDEGDIFQP